MLPHKKNFKTLESSSTNSSIAKISNSLVNSFVKKNNLVTLKVLFYLSSLELVIPKGSDICHFKFNVRDILSFCNVDLRTLRNNLKIMSETSLTFISEDLEGVARYEENITVLPYVKYDYKGFFEVKLFSKVLGLITDVKNKFTVIDINNLMSLKSKHSIKMIQLLEYINGFSSSVAKRKVYTLDDMNSLFGTNYQRFKDFERKVLIPVKDELDEFSSLTFLYEFNLDKVSSLGRPKITSVVIDLKSNKTRQLKLF